jgi:hypothetical protein
MRLTASIPFEIRCGPLYWRVDRHAQVVKRLREIGFKTGDSVGIEIDADDQPTVHRL